LPSSWLRIVQDTTGTIGLGALCNDCEQWRLVDPKGAAEALVEALRDYGGIPDAKIINFANVHKHGGRA
jgi:hypothetical protein